MFRFNFNRTLPQFELGFRQGSEIARTRHAETSSGIPLLN
jgi:hypothetical protein